MRCVSPSALFMLSLAFTHSTGAELRKTSCLFVSPSGRITGLLHWNFRNSDILSTSVAPSWDEIGKLTQPPVIRTALNYFLPREINEYEEKQRERAPSKTSQKKTQLRNCRNTAPAEVWYLLRWVQRHRSRLALS